MEGVTVRRPDMVNWMDVGKMRTPDFEEGGMYIFIININHRIDMSYVIIIENYNDHNNVNNNINYNIYYIIIC